MLVCAFGGLWTEMYGYKCTIFFIFFSCFFLKKKIFLDKVYGKSLLNINSSKFKAPSFFVLGDQVHPQPSTTRLKVTPVFHNVRPFPPQAPPASFLQGIIPRAKDERKGCACKDTTPHYYCRIVLQFL